MMHNSRRQIETLAYHVTYGLLSRSTPIKNRQAAGSQVSVPKEVCLIAATNLGVCSEPFFCSAFAGTRTQVPCWRLGCRAGAMLAVSLAKDATRAYAATSSRGWATLVRAIHKIRDVWLLEIGCHRGRRSHAMSICGRGPSIMLEVGCHEGMSSQVGLHLANIGACHRNVQDCSSFFEMELEVGCCKGMCSHVGLCLGNIGACRSNLRR
eukprot:1138014-Pelagomonas_calceolata.AAC.2